MDYLSFLKEKEELKIAARASVLFRALPEDLEKFEKEVGKMEHNPGSEKIVTYLTNLFKEANEQSMLTVETVQKAFAEQ
ncbi:MAG: hypothetical protein NTZ38_03640 [Candidatus Taylorbacteria bacterium]|nr:hypothetical protein [Candidatus Taylorbacteria bacterium]